MMKLPRKAVLSCGVAVGALAIATGAWAQQRAFDIPAQSATKAVPEFARQAGVQIISSGADLRGLQSAPVKGEFDVKLALAQLLDGTGLTWRGEGDTFIIERADAPQGGSAADGADGTVQALIVTAQKREENIQDVPIAMSAFTQEDLTRSQVAGGPDLITQVPNMTFTKTNFSSYSIQLRGIGTQAISATTDPAVAVAFNNTPFVRNRFFEQEFYDLQRVEVLRGPQGTLYGRNATAGVVNLISQKPKFAYEAKLSADAGNFNSTRLEGMVNVPLVNDKVALRIAGAWTKRDGYATNELTGNPIDGRDLWSTRVSLRVTPNDRLDVNLIWEHFQENDDRLRSGKQLCKKDVVTQVGNVTNIPYLATLPNAGLDTSTFSGVQGTLSQGCERESLYSSASFQTPNGLSIPYYKPAGSIGLPVALDDPYVSEVQSPDLRVIESTIDPDYSARSDLGELQVSFDLTDTLTLSSETAYSTDTVYSLQDFNRFNTAPGAWRQPGFGDRPDSLLPGPNGGIFCDPQLGCSDRLVAVDISTAKSRQFSQEFRLASDFGGAFNFSLGANFLRYDTEDKYYVFINSLSLLAANSPAAARAGVPYVAGVSDNSECQSGFPIGDPAGVYPVVGCIYMDPNPIGSLNDRGHNYFLSRNPYKLISYAAFGEAYYNITDNLKVTGGLRLTVDKKDAPRIPSWLLASGTIGYPVAEVVEQDWTEPTGRLAIDWKPDLSFTDQTLLYASYAHGYKAGGANPPGFIRVFYGDNTVAKGQASATRPKTFAAEFVDAFELGSKNTLADGRVTLNLAAFYYNYTDYQISEIVDRSAFNRNFDAEVWGLEIESDWRLLDNLRLGFKGGYEKTRIRDGEQAVDLMDRTAGNADWSLVRPFPTFASSCILPTFLFAHDGPVTSTGVPGLYGVGGAGGGNPGGCELAYGDGNDPVTDLPYVPYPTVQGGLGTLNRFWFPGEYPGFDPATAPNNGEGFFKQLGGNELPNAPHWTATVTSDYSLPMANDWLMTLHSDVHWQSQSWWRVFNDHVYDKLHPYFTMNLAAIFTNEEAGWNIMAYIKNVTDETAITGAFLNSDDTGLTTNVFLTEPRLYGLRVTKNWSSVAWLDSLGVRPAGPLPLTVEIGGQVLREDTPNDALEPASMSSLPAVLRTAGELQDSDMDWGDGRDAKVTWRPNGGPWTVAAAVRFGRQNSSGGRHTELKTDPACAYGGAYYDRCPIYMYTQTNMSDLDLTRHEEHRIIDFTVGREIGFGGLSKSSVAAGIRFGQFKSTASEDTSSIYWDFQDGWYFPYSSSFVRTKGGMHSDREFDGAGPLISWDASKSLLGSKDADHIDLDWSISGGVLFGKQKAAVTGHDTISLYDITGYSIVHVQPTPPTGDPVETSLSAHRSQSVTVPMVDLSLGLSYTVDRVRIGAGYRWERYFDVIDGGLDAAKDIDRTIDGPYFKIAVGFGG